MQIDLRKPGIQILLKKNVGRKTVAGSVPLSKRYEGTAAVVDLTPYLGEHGSVRVTKSVREPAGAFSIAFSDQIAAGLGDTLYALIEPMDSIEIYMAADSYQFAGGGLPIMMRGFVSTVQRQRGMSPDGKPSRSVVVSGQDYGKILQICQIYNLPFGAAVSSAITNFPFFTRFGFSSTPMTVSSFLNTVFSKIVNPYIANMRTPASQPQTGPSPQEQINTRQAQADALKAKSTSLLNQANAAIAAGNAVAGKSLMAQAKEADQLAAKVVSWQLALTASLQPDSTAPTTPLLLIGLDIQNDGDQLSPFGVGAWNQGTMYDLIQQFTDIGAWNEFFIEDRIDGPYAVFRPNPYIDASTGAFIFNDVTQQAVTHAITQIDDSWIVTMSCERTDANVGNFFWVDSPRFNYNHGDVARAIAVESSSVGGPESVLVTAYGNCNPNLYGTRKMQESTQMAGGTELYNGMGLNGLALSQSADAQIDWVTARRAALIEQNRDNVVFERGSMHLKGNENVKAGTYVQLTEGALTSQYYVDSVTHDYEPFGNYFTTAQFTRGTGFIARAQQSVGKISPYWSEVAAGMTS